MSVTLIQHARGGAPTRGQVGFAFLLSALSLGFFREALQPLAWRRTARAEFGRRLRQSLGGELSTVAVLD